MKKMKLFLFAVLIMSAGSIKAQTGIPNGGFEKWHMVDTIEVLDSGWVISEEMRFECNPIATSKTTDKASGEYALFLQSSTCANSGGIDFGFAHLDFPVNARPDTLYFKYKLEHNGPSFALVELSMDVRNPVSGEYEMVGKVYHTLTGVQNAYATVAVPITYVRNDMPQKAWLQIWADDFMNPGSGNKLWIDDVSFQREVVPPAEDTPTSISRYANVPAQINIYPNPASDKIMLNLNELKQGAQEILIFDMTGRQVMKEELYIAKSGVNSTALNISTLANGIYMLTMNVPGVGKVIRQFVKE